MEIPQDAIYRGILTIYLDTPLELEKAVKEYNKEMSENKPKMKIIRDLKEGFFIVNFVAIIGIVITSIFDKTALALTLLVLVAAAYILLGIKKGFLLTVPIANASLLLLSWIPAVVMLLADGALLMWYYKTLEPIKNSRGYPDFRTIDIVYEKRKQPQSNEKEKR